MKGRFVIGIILSVVCSLFIGSCGESDCSLSTISYARFDFLDSKTHKTVALTNGATVTGTINKDNTLITETVFNQATNYMSVPLSYTNQTTYVVNYSETLRDTIELTHKNIPFVNDIECGTLMFYEIESLRYTTNVLDSVTLVNPEINNEEKKNFNIYYRTADDN